MELAERIVTDENLEAAYQWACRQRIDRSHNHSIWDVRFHWEKVKQTLVETFLSHSYRLSPLKRYQIDGIVLDSWHTQDAILLKAMALQLQQPLQLKISSHCTHVKGHGGVKKTLEVVREALPLYRFILKADVKSYYASIDPLLLLKQLSEVIWCKKVLRVIRDYCYRLVWAEGEYRLITRGIPLGCSLSPLFGAWYLRELDETLSQEKYFYRRYMDDWIVLAKTRHHLRAAVKKTHQVLEKLRLKLHQDKTFIGRIEKGFKFLGCQFL